MIALVTNASYLDICLLLAAPCQLSDQLLSRFSVAALLAFCTGLLLRRSFSGLLHILWPLLDLTSVLSVVLACPCVVMPLVWLFHVGPLLWRVNPSLYALVCLCGAVICQLARFIALLGPA